ncbi:MAG: sodium:solute symporter family protein [Desulfobacteraceae bacterium]|jgi:SSS family solute:Na+ symporter|nr:MAG: sodium:solute symporter family protein [Desulfobacteraceae bacterium]
MITKLIVLGGYFLVVMVIGIYARTRLKSTPETYFLADRRLGAFVLLGTMAATNFSAFTIFGTSGAGYRDGYAFFPIMGFGTGFMALTFWVIGKKAWQIGKEKGVVTPPELIRVLYGSPFLSLLVSIVMIVFTIPYLALQPMAAGYALEELLHMPYFQGCILVTLLMVGYTFRGGMRAVAWTDLFQGFVMVAVLIAAFSLVVRHHGGFAETQHKVFEVAPKLFARPGANGTYTVGVWMSYLMLWFFADPMFPQLFQRFFSARSEKALKMTMLWYPAVCTLIFFIPISIGVMGRLSFPDLTGKAADRILPMVMNALGGDLMSSLVVAAGLAALMSTMDSQLLTLSSLFTRDILPVISKRLPETSMPGRFFVIALAALGLILAYRPPATILQIATQTFTGLAVLFPTVLFGIYLKKVYAAAAILSIVCGEGLLVLFYTGILSGGIFLPVVWVMAAGFAVYLVVHAVFAAKNGTSAGINLYGRIANPYLFGFTSVFFLGIDFWAWNWIGPTAGGIPLWIPYYILLSAVQTLLMYIMVR